MLYSSDVSEKFGFLPWFTDIHWEDVTFEQYRTETSVHQIYSEVSPSQITK